MFFCRNQIPGYISSNGYSLHTGMACGDWDYYLEQKPTLMQLAYKENLNIYNWFKLVFTIAKKEQTVALLFQFTWNEKKTNST